VLRHATEHHIPAGVEAVLPLCRRHLLHSLLAVLDLAKAASSGHFQTRSGAFNHPYTGISTGEQQQAPDAYCWVIGVLFGA
jgi:hypothetical protein